MADTSAFDVLVPKLPIDLQARFAAVSAQVKDLPPDDDLALALEVVGIAALTLKEVPGNVSDAIGRIRLDICDDPREELEAALVRWLDESCYRRLRATLRLVKDGHSRGSRGTAGWLRQLSDLRRWLAEPNRLRRRVAFSLCACAGCVAIVLGLSRIAHSEKDHAVPDLPPPVEHGMIGYHEAEIAEAGGRVGMILVEGDVLGAFKEGERGVVIVKPVGQP